MESYRSLEPGDPEQVGQYRIVGRLGAGGMGRVYLGRSRGGRVFAVKVVRPELAEDGEFRARFAREVAAARLVNGVYTAGVVDADPDGSPPWLATAYVPGIPLDLAVAGSGAWPEVPVSVLAAGLAEALEAIHAAGIVHRDLKPSNILLASDGPRVIDFGISVAGEAGHLTRTGVVVGTPGFMSPEQLTGARVGPESDVFALGAVLAFTAAGSSPFGAGSAQGLMFRIVYEEPDLGAIPPGLLPLVTRCLAKRPADRPSVAEILDTLTGGGGVKHATLAFAGAGWLPESVAGALRERGLPGSATVPGESPGDTAAEPGTAPAAGGVRPGPGPGGEPPAAGTRGTVPGTPPPALPPEVPPGFGPPRGGPPGYGGTPDFANQRYVSPPTPPPYGYAPTAPFTAGSPMGTAAPPMGPPPVPHPGVRPGGPPSRRRDGSRAGVIVLAVAAVVVVTGLLAWLIPERLGDSAGKDPSSAPSGASRSPARTGGDPGTATKPGSGSVAGTWRGNYLCNQGVTGLLLTITEDGGGGDLEAVFSFHPSASNPAVPRGSFAMTGSLRDGTLSLKGDRWIDRPDDYLMVDLEARYDNARPDHLDGKVIGANCTSFSADRSN